MLADLGVRGLSHPFRPKFLRFYADFDESSSNNRFVPLPFAVGVPVWEIQDPPLHSYKKQQIEEIKALLFFSYWTFRHEVLRCPTTCYNLNRPSVL